MLPLKHARKIEQMMEHWAEFRPKEYARMVQDGTLYPTLERIAEEVLGSLQAGLDAGMDYDQAWELAREPMYPPPETP